MNECWLSVDEYSERPAAALSPWLTDPGWLTPRLRAAAGRSGGFHLVGQKALPLDAALREKLDVDDDSGLLREIEFRCGDVRWLYAQSIIPRSTINRFPWLAELGQCALGEKLKDLSDVVRGPREYLELSENHSLAKAARLSGSSWARRVVLRLSRYPMLITEVFMPELVSRCRSPK